MAKRLRDSGDKEQGGRQKRRPPSSLARLDTADFDEAVGLGKREVEAKALEMCKTPEERSRYQHYRRSHFNTRYVRRVMCQSTAVEIKAGDKVCVIMAGLAKLFVGNIVERARSMMTDRGESGPIRCSHLREAFVLMREEGRLPYELPMAVLR